MSNKESCKKKKPRKSYFNENEKRKDIETKNPKKIIKSKRKKENIKNAQSKNSFDIDIVKKANFVVNQYTNMLKALEKNYGSETNKDQLKKKKVYTDYKIQKISGKFKYNSEKNEISKTAETSKNKIEFRIKRKKIYNYAKVEKNSEEKNKMNDHLEEYNSQKNKNKNNCKRKNNKLNENEIYENKPNEYSEDIKNDKILKLNENNIYINKCKLYKNDYVDDFIENKSVLENIKNKRQEKKEKIKLNLIYIIFLIILY